MFGKVMSISDELMWRWYELLSVKTLDDIASLKRDVESGARHPKLVKEELALEMTARYHGEAKAAEARQEFNAVFVGGGVPDDAPTHICKSGEASTPVFFLTDAGLTASRGEARRLVAQNALSVDDTVYTDGAAPLPAGEYVIKLGKKRFLRLTVQ